jgi:hypothetical protein
MKREKEKKKKKKEGSAVSKDKISCNRGRRQCVSVIWVLESQEQIHENDF